MLYDPKTKQFTQIDTCFDADHNHFAENAESTLYFGQNNTLGWIDTAVFDKTKNAEAAQGWCPAVIDTTGDGKITQWTEPEQPPDPAKDRRVTFGCYSVGVDAEERQRLVRRHRPARQQAGSHRAGAEPAADVQGRGVRTAAGPDAGDVPNRRRQRRQQRRRRGSTGAAPTTSRRSTAASARR